MPHVNRGINAVGGFLGVVVDNPSWYRLRESKPEVAAQVVQTVGQTAASGDLASMRIPPAASPHGARYFDAMRTATLETMRELTPTLIS